MQIAVVMKNVSFQKLHYIHSTLVMQFGQFLDHDLTFTAEADHMCLECDIEQPPQCCDYYLGLRNYTIEQMPDDCWPISVPENDRVFQGSEAPRCIDFRRSLRSACRSPRKVPSTYYVKAYGGRLPNYDEYIR